MNTVRDRVQRIVEKYYGETIGAGEVSLIEDLSFDSLQLVECLAELEEEFAMSFEEGEGLLDLVDNLEAMINYISENVPVH